MTNQEDSEKEKRTFEVEGTSRRSNSAFVTEHVNPGNLLDLSHGVATRMKLREIIQQCIQRNT